MKASEAYRLMADMAEKTGAEDLTENLVATFISHMAIDLCLPLERILGVVRGAHQLMAPGFDDMREAISQMKPEDMTNLDKLEKVSDAGIAALIQTKGPSS